MRINIHIDPHFEHHFIWGEAFAKGVLAHGLMPQVISGFNPGDCDLAVFWSHHPRTMAIRERQRANGLDYLVMERGYLGDRKKWTSLGYNGQNGRADFLNVDSPSDRWDRYPKWVEKPWNPGNEYILLIGQVPTDSAVGHINFERWIYETIKHLEWLIDLPVKFRPHPITEGRYLSHHYEKKELIEDLSQATCVVTFNSTAGVDAVMDGIPVIALDRGSMAWPVAGHQLEDIKNPPMPDRSQWLYDLAYTQWTKREIKSGKAWEHLKSGPVTDADPVTDAPSVGDGEDILCAPED